jgi:hypothetical protein
VLPPADGQTASGVNFGTSATTHSVLGRATIDHDGDGVPDPEDAPAAGRTVTLITDGSTTPLPNRV